MAKIKQGVQYHQVASGMKSKGQGREPHPTTKEIESGVQERLSDRQFGKDNGFLLELDEGEEIKNVRPKLMSVGKKLMITLGSETQADERAMWIWVVAEGRQARQTSEPSNEEPEPAAPRRRGRATASSGR
jgi:hypothetical protein